ncbi:MAG TPA: SCO2322 family protein [Dermatophilaceae bacterium]
MKPPRHTRHASPSRMARAAVILILVTLAGGLAAAPAQAASYRYWGYFHLTKGAWAFAQTGPAQALPADGTVEGWRFAVADESSVRTPRALPTFKALCAGTAVKSGDKRVGLVIDYGRPADAVKGDTAKPPAPQAVCVTAPVKATGSDVLVAGGATLRLDKGITCGLDGWPAAGCGEPVAPVPAAAAAPDTKIVIAAPAGNAMATTGKPAAESSNSSRSLILGGAGVVVLVALLGFTAWRRGRDATDS